MKIRRLKIAAVLVMAAFLLSAAAGYAGPPVWEDNFDSETLDPSWFWVNENPDKWNLTEREGYLRIYAAEGPTGSENLLLRLGAEGNFAIETYILFEPTTNYQIAGLVIYQDGANFLQFGRAYCDVPDVCVGNGIYFDNTRDGELVNDNFSISVDSPSESYLCLERRGGMVKAFFSDEGTTWFEVGTHWIPDEFQVNGVGLVASQNYGEDEPPIAADFDYFELTENGGFLPEGYHDYHSGEVPQWACQAGGWAVDPDDRTANVQVEIVVDGDVLITVLAERHRDDLAVEPVCANGDCGFEVSLWDLVSTYQTHSVTVNARDLEANEWVRLFESPKDLTCRSYDIYIYDVQSGETRQITLLDDTWEFNPRWSPNGKQIVHDRWLMDFKTGEHENLGIYITDVTTGKSTPLMGGEQGNYPSWSPNGQWIAFSQDEVGVFVVPATGGIPKLVVEDGYLPSWSPNSKRLAFQSGTGEILTIDIQGKGEAILVASGEAAAWSPNGQWIAYTLNGDLWKGRVDPLGKPLGDPIQLTFDPDWEGRASWSQDSKTIVFHADYGEDTDIWTIPAIGGFPTRLTGGEYFDDYDPNYSNNGRFVAYASYTPNVQTYVPFPRIVASVEGDWFWTTDFRQGTVNISIYESQEPNAGILWQGVKDTDEYGFAMIEPGDHGLDLLPGNVVVVADRVTTKVLVLEDITMTVFDTENDYLAGFAPAHTRVWVAAGPQDWQEGISVRSKGNTGEWEADFASVGFDITEDMRPWSYAQIFDEDGDANEADPPPLMQLRVNYGHDWVESFYEEGHTVYLTVTESNGVTEKATATALTGPREDWGWESGFSTNDIEWDGGVTPDLHPYDWVYAEVDNGVKALVQLGEVFGDVNITTDSISGSILADWIEGPVFVQCLDWGSGMGDPINKDFGDLYTDGSDPYECGWDPTTEWDIQPWQDIGVGYFTPDGHWVANAFRGEFWVAMWTYDPGSGVLPESDFNYTFDWSYADPEPYGEITGPITATVLPEAQLYDGYALLRTNAAAPLFAWTGSSCEAITNLNPGQPVLFVLGWVNNYSMSEEDAWVHFNSFEVNVSWDGPGAGSAALSMGDLVVWYGMETSYDYRCSLTGH